MLVLGAVDQVLHLADRLAQGRRRPIEGQPALGLSLGDSHGRQPGQAERDAPAVVERPARQETLPEEFQRPARVATAERDIAEVVLAQHDPDRVAEFPVERQAFLVERLGAGVVPRDLRVLPRPIERPRQPRFVPDGAKELERFRPVVMLLAKSALLPQALDRRLIAKLERSTYATPESTDLP